MDNHYIYVYAACAVLTMLTFKCSHLYTAEDIV